ncbi:polysaccharide deacetylase family protein [Pokkaliibacter sp. CJK22405]|uniref:polysaccharide deacetylase family protein n=1 Tax=Pokkaliibacter sp. CJK22405 TaxID=3384615 RepID=UPI0039846843
MLKATLTLKLKEWRGQRWLRSQAARQQLLTNGLVLMLHRIVEDEDEAALPHRNELCVAASTFDRFLGWLASEFDCVALTDLLEQPAGGKQPRVALTFDDGWEDNARLALPLLQKHQLTASVFVTTDFPGNSTTFWWESIGERLFNLNCPTQDPVLLQALADAGMPVPEGVRRAGLCPQQRSFHLQHYLASLKTLSDDTLISLAALAASGQPQAMDWPAIRQLEQSGHFRFGAHGASHALLDRLSPQELSRELDHSLAALAREVRQPLPIYCYPNGNYNAEVQAALRQRHIPWALSTRPGLVTGTADPLGIPRICLSQRAAARPGLLGWRIRMGAKAGRNP